MADKRTANAQSAPTAAQPTDAALQPFNLATMSGVFPGSRTQIFQRARVLSMAATPTNGWIQLLWDEGNGAPRRCKVFLATPGSATPAAPLLELTVSELSQFHPQLAQALQQVGWQLASCGTCQHWRSARPPGAATTESFFPIGRCHWDTDGAKIPRSLRQQSPLALQCPHWHALNNRAGAD